MMHNIAEAMKSLQRLLDLGIAISIDDFGTWYPYLSYLTMMPISELKSDFSFIINIPGEAGSAAIVSTNFGMAGNLTLEVVSEGVESVEQYRCLSGLRRMILQGFYFSHPLPTEAFASFVRE